MPAHSKFTADVRERLLKVKGAGGPDTLACAYAGITDETLRRWLAKGREADEGLYAEFATAYDEAKSAPQVRALMLLQKKLPDSDTLLMKYIERQVAGYEPLQPIGATAAPQVSINLSLTGSAVTALPSWIEGEVIEDAQEVPALSDGGSGDPAEAGNP